MEKVPIAKKLHGSYSNTSAAERSQIGETAELLVPIARALLRSGKAASEFMSAAKLACARAAERDIAPVAKRTNVSRIAALTGLTRREVKGLLRPRIERRVEPASSVATQPLARVVDAWQRERTFTSKSKSPRVLKLVGETNSFEALVAAHGGDVTVVAVLKELERVGCVRRVGKDRVQLVRKKVALLEYSPEAMLGFGRKLSDFTEALDSQMRCDENHTFLDVRDTNQLSLELLPLFKKIFSERATNLLEGFETWAKSNSSDNINNRAQRVGLGVYLIAPHPFSTKD